MNKIILAGLVAVTATVAFAAPSEAHHRWRHNHWWGPYHNVVVVDPYYGDDSACYVKKIKKYNKWGERVVKFVNVCY